MKAVPAVDLMSLSDKRAKKPKKTKVKTEVKEAQEPVKSKAKPKTYSLEDRHEQQINAVALGLSQKRGKMVGASEALRYILDKVDGKISE